jgi:hypothetical protein
MDSKTGTNCGYAFVDYKKLSIARNIEESMKPLEIDGELASVMIDTTGLI